MCGSEGGICLKGNIKAKSNRVIIHSWAEWGQKGRESLVEGQEREPVAFLKKKLLNNIIFV